MPERCRACSHPKRAAINDALMKQTSSTAALADEYGLSIGGLKRHKANHLRFSPSAADDSANALTIIGYANDLYRRAESLLQRAESMLKEKDSSARGVQAAAVSLREVRASIELLAKLVVSGEQVDPVQASRDAELDAALSQAVASMVLPALGVGDVVDAVVVD